MTPSTRTEIWSAAALVGAIAVTLSSAGPALDAWLSQSQAADLAAADVRQQQAHDRAVASLRRQLQASCGNGVPELATTGSGVSCAPRTPRGR